MPSQDGRSRQEKVLIRIMTKSLKKSSSIHMECWWMYTRFWMNLMRNTINQTQNAHYYDVIMGAIASQITSPTIVYSTVYLDADQSKHQSSASLAFVREIHRGPVNFPHKWPATRKMFPFDDVIMKGRELKEGSRRQNVAKSSRKSDNKKNIIYIYFTYLTLEISKR